MPSNTSILIEPPLLRTKISIPQITSGFVSRPRLIEQVNRGVKGPLTLLATPAGFGKTQLLIEWSRETDLPIAWLTIDNQDNDIYRFFSYFIGALQTMVPGFGDEALEFIQLTQASNLEAAMTYLINNLSGIQKDMVLVFDDFQDLENPAALQGLSFLIRYLPPNLHLIIASRTEPELDLTFLRAKGRVVEINAADLRFTRLEVGQYFQQGAGLQLTHEMLLALEERTDGWIASIQMAAVSLKHNIEPATLLKNLHGKAHYLSGFLAEEVLDRQPDDIRQFLLKSCILEKLSGPLCEAVVDLDAQPGYGRVMLNRLEHNHLFIIPLDEKHEWFRYHHLFADFLYQVQAEINPTEIPEVHKRAALWLEQNGQLDDAFEHAFASRDMEWAAEMLERNVGSLSNKGEMSALIRWIGKLPDELTQKRLLLGATYAWALTVTDQLDLARYWLDDVQRSLDQREIQAGENRTIEKARVFAVAGYVDLSGIQGILAICRSHLAILSGELNRAAEFSRQATSFLPEENSYTRSLVALDESISLILSGDIQKAIESLRVTIRIAHQAHNQYVMVVAGCALAEMQAWQGQLGKAWETYQRVKNWALGPEGKPLNMTGVVDMGLGEILLERNILEEAMDHLERGCRIAQSVWYIASLHGMISLARVRQALGDQAGVQAVIAEVERMTHSKESSEWEDIVPEVIAIRLAVQRDDLAAAETWWKKGGFPELSIPIAIEKYPYHVYEYLILVQARFLLVRGQETSSMDDIKQAASMLIKLSSEAERLQRVSSQIQILILLAMAQFYVRDETALQTLLRALALGEPEGFRRFFLDEGWRLAELMRQCRSRQEKSGSHLPSLTFIDSLLKDLQRTGPTIAKLDDGIPITLSAREMEVLALIAEGKSNQEISAQLFLAINTVKRHVYNIFTKLEVEKRTQAVSKARQLGLIP